MVINCHVTNKDNNLISLSLVINPTVKNDFAWFVGQVCADACPPQVSCKYYVIC